MPDAFERLKTALQGGASGPFASRSDCYAVERELGIGGMATVYLAEDLKHHRKVAVKVLRPEIASSIAAARFLREIEIAAHLTHPHILTLLDSGNTAGFLYFVMPYVEGESLRAKLSREGELPVFDAIRVLRDVVDALAYAHEHGVVHRDVKPGNILICENHALVTDFGVAKAVSHATGGGELTTAGFALGTPEYMAPEQAAADPHTDHRADIYGVGTLAYELLTGRPPFAAASPQAVLAAQVTERPEPVTKYRAAVPPALEHLVMKCLEKRPADRWQSSQELLPQLEALVSAPALVDALMPTRAGLAPAEQTAPSVAVLPFADLSAGGGNGYFTDSMTEAVMNALSKLEGLRVSARTSCFAFKGKHEDVRRIGAQLNVCYVLEGSVLTSGKKIRIATQLINAADGFLLWSDTYDRDLEDVFAVQDEVAREIIAALRDRLGSEIAAV